MLATQNQRQKGGIDTADGAGTHEYGVEENDKNEVR